MVTGSRSKLARLIGKVRPRYLSMAIKRPSHAVQYLNSLRVEQELKTAPERLADICHVDRSEIASYFAELEQAHGFNELFYKRWNELNKTGRGSTPPNEAKVLYALCRTIKPDTVVVSGTGYGGFDAHIVNALEQNGRGQLYSIDLPKEWSPFECGYAVPDNLRHRWHLRLEDSKTALPDALQTYNVDLFLHDSLHTAEWMTWEFTTAYKHLNPGSYISSHDVLHNFSWDDFVEKHNLPHTRVITTGIAEVQH